MVQKKKTKSTKKSTRKKRTQKNKNRKALRIISKISAVLVVPFIITLFIIITISSTLLNGNFHKDNFAEIGLYERMIDEGVPAIINNIDIENDTAATFLVRKGVILLFQNVVRPEWLQDRTELVIDNIMIFANKKPEREAQDVEEFFESIRTGYVSNLLSKLPQMKTSLPACDQGIVKFIFPNVDCETYNQTTSYIEGEIAIATVYIENSHNELIDFTYQIEDQAKAIIFLKKVVTSLTLYAAIILLIILAGMFFIGWAKFPSAGKMLRGISIPTFIASAVTLLIGYIGLWVMGIYTGNIKMNLILELESILSDLIDVTVKNTFGYLNRIAWIILIISAVAWIGSYIYERTDWKRVNKWIKNLNNKVF